VQVSGGPVTSGLVLGKAPVAKRRDPGIHCNGEQPRGTLPENLQERTEEHKDRGGVSAGGVQQRPIEKGEIPPVDDAVTIDEVQLTAHVEMSTSRGAVGPKWDVARGHARSEAISRRRSSMRARSNALLRALWAIT